MADNGIMDNSLPYKYSIVSRGKVKREVETFTLAMCLANGCRGRVDGYYRNGHIQSIGESGPQGFQIYPSAASYPFCFRRAKTRE